MAGGVTCTAHRAPFHRSATVPLELELAYEPTAVHAVADVHETDLSAPTCAPGTDASGSTAQFLPFHRSASAGPPLRSPTAMHIPGSGQETPSSLACMPWGGSRTPQVRPFHSSASAVWLPRLPTLPTAMHQAGPAQDTADSAAPLPGLGAGWIAHRRPFHRSATVPTSVDPTAVQADADVHDTPAKLATDPPGRLLPAAARGMVPPEATARGESRAAETAGAGAWPPAVHAASSAAATIPVVVLR
jgi:hypothetical protein